MKFQSVFAVNLRQQGEAWESLRELLFYKPIYGQILPISYGDFFFFVLFRKSPPNANKP